MTARKVSPGTKPKLATEQGRSKSTTPDSEPLDAVAACETAQQIVSDTRDLQRLAASRDPTDERSSADPREGRRWRQAVADTAARLGESLGLLENLLDKPSIVSALQAVHGYQPVNVQHELYLCFSEAAFRTGLSLFVELFDIEFNGDDRESIKPYLASDPGMKRLSDNILYRGIISGLLEKRPEQFLRELIVHIKSERSRLQSQTNAVPVGAGASADGRQHPMSEPPGKESGAELTTAPRAPTKAEKRGEWLGKAMPIVRDHPDWSDARIALEIGKHPSTLTRSREYQVAAVLARGSKADLPQGHITVDDDSKRRDVEAIAPPAGQPDNKADRGQPIAGSKYFREYCAECDEVIMVPQDKVGTNPVCEHCRKG